MTRPRHGNQERLWPPARCLSSSNCKWPPAPGKYQPSACNSSRPHWSQALLRIALVSRYLLHNLSSPWQHWILWVFAFWLNAAGWAGWNRLYLLRQCLLSYHFIPALLPEMALLSQYLCQCCSVPHLCYMDKLFLCDFFFPLTTPLTYMSFLPDSIIVCLSVIN